jgi:hypothetical protein
VAAREENELTDSGKKTCSHIKNEETKRPGMMYPATGDPVHSFSD